MTTGPWESWGSAANECAWEYAKIQAKSIASRPLAARGRSELEIAMSTFPSIIAEVFQNRDNIAWWREHWRKAQVKGDDGGYDDRYENGVKAILVRKNEIWNEDWRAEVQYVYEVDVKLRRIRFLGTFTRDDARMITMDDGRMVGVVLREQLH